MLRLLLMLFLLCKITIARNDLIGRAWDWIVYVEFSMIFMVWNVDVLFFFLRWANTSLSAVRHVMQVSCLHSLLLYLFWITVVNDYFLTCFFVVVVVVAFSALFCVVWNQCDEQNLLKIEQLCVLILITLCVLRFVIHNLNCFVRW